MSVMHSLRVTIGSTLITGLRPLLTPYILHEEDRAQIVTSSRPVLLFLRCSDSLCAIEFSVMRDLNSFEGSKRMPVY